MASRFLERQAFRADGYQLLPFRFSPFDDARYLLTNDAGEYALVPREDLVALVEHRLAPASPSYAKLKSRQFFMDVGASAPLHLLALKVRTRAEPIAQSTGLHLFVVTLRCDHSCHYCQVSRRTEDKAEFDMSQAHADKALDLVFKSPSPALKIEFQGGEPLLAFDRVKYVVERAHELNRLHGRDLEFVIASNLSRLDDEVLAFCAQYGVKLSTSLDGPAGIHDAQRPTASKASHEATVEGIRRARSVLGAHAVSALMTTTLRSLACVEEIVDEYVRNDFHSIFFRPLSPYGFAARKSLTRRYDVEDWVAFYKRGLAHVMAVNEAGYPLREEYAAILLDKMFAPAGSRYVDLQSPAGLGIGALVYNYDGAVYASDEARMLAEMGDTSLKLGSVEDDYATIFGSERLHDVLDRTMTEGTPMCSECAFLPFCGSDPAFHQATQGDVVGHKAFSGFCARQMAVLRHLIDLLENGGRAAAILRSWTSRC